MQKRLGTTDVTKENINEKVTYKGTLISFQIIHTVDMFVFIFSTVDQALGMCVYIH